MALTKARLLKHDSPVHGFLVLVWLIVFLRAVVVSIPHASRGSYIGCPNLYTNAVRWGPCQTSGKLFGVYMYISLLSLQSKQFGYTPNLAC